MTLSMRPLRPSSESASPQRIALAGVILGIGALSLTITLATGWPWWVGLSIACGAAAIGAGVCTLGIARLW